MRLTKHHGLGNDFLVLLDLDGATGVDGAAAARALCQRRTGIGADGLIIVGPPADADADVTMVLHNADGSRAEMSGNGIRCLAQAVAMHRGEEKLDLRVSTDAGLRVVEVRSGTQPHSIEAAVDMGAARPIPPGMFVFTGSHSTFLDVDMGNPHQVYRLSDARELRRTVDGWVAAAASGHVFSMNLEAVLPGPEADAITMRVVERGVGETLACGTGACAAAWAAREWGLVGERVTVHMPGGDALVELGATITLTGPAVHIATIDVPEDAWR